MTTSKPVLNLAAVCCCATPVFCTNLLILISISVRWLGGCLDCFVEWLVSWFVSLWLVGELLDWFMVGWIVCRWLIGAFLDCLVYGWLVFIWYVDELLV